MRLWNMVIVYINNDTEVTSSFELKMGQLRSKDLNMAGTVNNAKEIEYNCILSEIQGFQNQTPFP